jgi:hypothetical protein
MISSFLSALFGRCPACGRGALYKSYLTFHEHCPVCHVRYERWSGSWTIPVVMGYGSGALFAIGLGFLFYKTGRLDGSENIIIPATLVFTALFYPVCKNVSMFMLYNNGFVFVDPPQLVEPLVNDEREPGVAPAEARAAAPPEAARVAGPADTAVDDGATARRAPLHAPPDDDPTIQEGNLGTPDDPTDDGGEAA